MSMRGDMVTPSPATSPTKSPPPRPLTTGKSSAPNSKSFVLPKIAHDSKQHVKQAWPVLMKRAIAESHLAPFIAYSTPNSGAVDHWKKLAKKAQLEMFLERDSHRADNMKNNVTIHRINRRLMPLEKALVKTKEAMKEQAKLVDYLRCRIHSTDERKCNELYLRSQTEALQKKLVGATQMSERKICELQNELRQAVSQSRIIQEQLNEIYMHIDGAPGRTEVSGSSEDNPEDSISDDKNIHQHNKQGMGLIIIEKICKLQLHNQQFGRKVKENNEQISRLVQDNERLTNLAQEAMRRNNKFTDLVHTLKAERDLTMSRLKGAEDIIRTLESMQDFVHSCTFLHDAKTTSSSQGNFIPGTLVYKPAYQKQEAQPFSTAKKAECDLQSSSAALLEATDLTAMGPGLSGRAVYFKDDIKADSRSIGTSLLKKLQEAFQMLTYKIETANQTVFMVTKEREAIQIATLETLQELSGQRSLKQNAADITRELLMAVRELKGTVEELKKENDLLKATGSKEKEKFMQLQREVHDLSRDRMALVDVLGPVKNVLRASNVGQGAIQCAKGLLDTDISPGEFLSKIPEMIECLLKERNEARSLVRALKEHNLLKEKELCDLKKLYAESKTFATDLQVGKGLLEKERDELKTSCENLTRDKSSWDAKKGETDNKVLGLQSQVHDLILNRNALLETLDGIKNTIRATNLGEDATQDFKGSLSRSVGQGENIGEVLQLVKELLVEKEHAKSIERRLTEQVETKERELDDARKLEWQSQSLRSSLEQEKGALQNHLTELEKVAHSMKIEKDLLRMSSQEMRNKLSELQTQIHNLALDNAAFLETLETLRKLFSLATLGGQLPDHSQGCTQQPIHRENVTDLLVMGQKLLNERNEALSGDSRVREEKTMTEKELSVLRQLYSESKTLCTTLHNEKDELQREVEDSRTMFGFIEALLHGEGISSKEEVIGTLGVTRGNLVNEVSTIMENLDSIKAQLSNEHKMFERKLQEMKSIIGNQDHTSGDLESEAALLILSLRSFNGEKEQVSTALRGYMELQGIVEQQMKRLVEIMVSDDADRRTSIGDENGRGSDPQTLKENTLASDLKNMIADLPDLVEGVGKLKREKDNLFVRLESVECEKQAAVRKNSEHQDKILKLSDDSEQEIRDLRLQIDEIQTLVSSITDNGAHWASEGNTSKQDFKHHSVLGELSAVMKEFLFLQKKTVDLGVTATELRLQTDHEQKKVHDLANELLVAETRLQTLSVHSLAADSRLKKLESQYADAEAQLSEVYSAMVSKDPVQASEINSSEVHSIGSLVQAIQNKVLELQLARDKGVNQNARELDDCKSQLEVLTRELRTSNAEVEKLREKLSGQGDFIKKHTVEWTRVVENLKSEVIRLGGADPKDEEDRLRRSRAAEKVASTVPPELGYQFLSAYPSAPRQVKEIVSQALTVNPPVPHPQTSVSVVSQALTVNPPVPHPQTSTDASVFSNPLLSLATFQVDLLVNSKVHSQLKVAGHNGGLCQAVLHYFYVDARTGDITFENASVPGSQSSNLLVDLFLQPVDNKKGYQSQAGDILGLCVKVSALNDPSPREVLFNTNILRTDEVMEAIHGQMIQNFSLWPDVVSSWRWERDMRKSRWSLVSVRWRFLLKNVFPDLSAPLQDLTSKGVGPARSSSIYIS